MTYTIIYAGCGFEVDTEAETVTTQVGSYQIHDEVMPGPNDIHIFFQPRGVHQEILRILETHNMGLVRALQTMTYAQALSIIAVSEFTADMMKVPMPIPGVRRNAT